MITGGTPYDLGHLEILWAMLHSYITRGKIPLRWVIPWITSPAAEQLLIVKLSSFRCRNHLHTPVGCFNFLQSVGQNSILFAKFAFLRNKTSVFCLLNHPFSPMNSSQLQVFHSLDSSSSSSCRAKSHCSASPRAPDASKGKKPGKIRWRLTKSGSDCLGLGHHHFSMGPTPGTGPFLKAKG